MGWYEYFTTRLDSGRKMDRKKIANNTYIRREGQVTEDSRPELIIRLHATDIMRLRSDGSTVLVSGGWRTVTTKERMNRWTPEGIRIYSDKGVWFVQGWGVTELFHDGMVVGPDGYVEPPAKSDMSKYQLDVAMKLRINQFCKGMTDEVIAKAVRDSGGDCLYCIIDAQSERRDEWATSEDHLEMHMVEKYYVANMMVAALRFTGHRPDVYLGGYAVDSRFMRQVVRRSCNRYMQARLLEQNKGRK